MYIAAQSERGESFVSSQSASPSRGLTYGLARESEERLGAFRLIHDAYVRAGLGQPTPAGMRVTPYQILPTSQIFVGKLGDQVVSTVSLIGDGELGLPMEIIFGAEVRALRQQGERLGEVSCLADRRQDGRRFLATFRQLTRLVAQFARYEGIQSLLITVHPRHVRFYQDLLGFVPISDRVAACPYVRGNPAVALQLQFARIDRERPSCYDEYFGQWLDRELLRPYTISREELEFLSGLTTAMEMFQVANFVKPQPLVPSELQDPLAPPSVPTLASSF